MANYPTVEHQRLDDTTHRQGDWKCWGPYLSERAWGTVREDYSATGEAWEYFPHEHARSRVYRWNEDGLAGICDRNQLICFSLALWNGRDPILKERLYGVTGNEGNHGEDVKEYYFYLDSTPTHSYMKFLYKYPHAEFPYARLSEENRRRDRLQPEFELLDTGVFDGDRYFDVFVEYAKVSQNDLLIKVQAWNRGPEPAEIHMIPQIYFRNTWSWGLRDSSKPELYQDANNAVELSHHEMGEYWWYCEDEPKFLFTENETNFKKVFGLETGRLFVKDAFHEYVVHGNQAAVNPEKRGTKAGAFYRRTIAPGGHAEIRMRLTDCKHRMPFVDFQAGLVERIKDANDFYDYIQPSLLNKDERSVQRQAFAGLMWSKQWYHYGVEDWLNGDPGNPKPPEARKNGRNREWYHLNATSVISMPDKWEYPWFAAWDLAFHCIPMAMIDPELAKRQLILMLREWYMHPNGQIPAYEWAFGDVNPPVHAWACWRVYKIEKKATGKGDTVFLEKCFHKLLLNFTWWVNRKDAAGNNVFQGGFLGMDNIGVFDRSSPLPTGGHIEQSDGTSWMGMYCLNLMTIALELAHFNPSYEDVATKFFEHFMYIARSMNNMGGMGFDLWDEEDEFFYDVLHLEHGEYIKMKVRSMVGLVPLLAVETLDPDIFERFPRFKRRMDWFLNNRPDMARLVSRWHVEGTGHRHLLALLRGHRMKQVLKRMLDTSEFLSDYGIRALSKHHQEHPYVFKVNGDEHRVDYVPGESRTGLFGGNSNWRGPIWWPVNYLLIESLQKFHHYYSDDFRVEYPTGSGQMMTLQDVANQLSTRLTEIFLKDPKTGRRAVYGDNETFQNDPHWKDHILFYEYFHADSGRGLGASHQTGWTALVAKLFQHSGEERSRKLSGFKSGDTLRLSQ